MQFDKPLLSVLVPAYNVEKYIGACIRSLLRQTYPAIEILICDDASSDNTWEKANEFSDDRLHAFRNSNNLGKNQTSDFLLKHCKGDYVTIHDADDFSSPDRFENQISFLVKNPEYAMCGSNYISFLNNGKVIARSNLSIDDAVIREQIKRQSQFHGPTIVIKKSVIADVGGLYRFFKRAEDIDLTMRVTEKFKVCNLPGYYYYYRHQPFSLTNDVKGYSIERLAHFKLLYYLAEERASNHGIDTLMLGDMNRLNRLVSEFKKEYEHDPEIALRRGAFRLLYMRLYSNAVKVAWVAMVDKPNIINLKCLVYTLIHYVKGKIKLIRTMERVDPGLL